MITDDEVLDLFTQADPARTGGVAPRAEAARYLDTLVAKSTDVTLTEIRSKPSEPRSPHRWLLTAAAVALVLFAGSALALVLRDDAKPASHPPIQPTPLQVANSFLQALTTFDADGAATYLANETTATAGLVPGRDVDDWRLAVRFFAAAGWKFHFISCHEQVTTSLGTVVRCPFEYHAFHSDELGLGPYGGSAIDLTISDGKIVGSAVALQTAGTGVISELLRPFNAWLRSNYPGEIESLYADANILHFRITDESVPTWEARSQEYADKVLAGRTSAT